MDHSRFLKCSDKHFIFNYVTLDVRGCQEVISLDRLKPAHLQNSHAEELFCNIL